jgi:cobalt-zinc-cadmium efflux system protein
LEREHSLEEAPDRTVHLRPRLTSILAALANAIVLLITIGGIAWEALRRLAEPEPVAEITIIIVAAVGIVVNGITAWFFASGW